MLTLDVEFNQADLTFESNDGPNALEANIQSIWDVRLTQPSDALIEIDSSGDAFQAFLFNLYNRGDDRWTIRLADDIPIDLQLTGQATASLLDLRDVILSNLTLDVDTGAFQLYLPETEMRYNVDVQTGPDASVIRVPEGASLDMTLDTTLSATIMDIGENVDMTLNAEGGFGGISIAVPDSAAVRVITDSTALALPPNFEQQGEFWQTPGFLEAENQIFITYEGGPGALEIR